MVRNCYRGGAKDNSPHQADAGKAAECQERAQALRENAKGILDDTTRLGGSY
jgi:hypothetical protein